jgi:DNA-binding Xre family transcriptional regulator
MPRPEVVTEKAAHNGRVLAAFIKKHWRGKEKALADAADISTAKLSELKNKGFETPVPSLRAVCHVLAIDADKLCEGRIVRLDTPSKESELVAIARRLVGTGSEEQATSMLRHILELRADRNP